jgi:hypothetical protein
MRTIPQAVAGSESRGGDRNASPQLLAPRAGRKGHAVTGREATRYRSRVRGSDSAREEGTLRCEPLCRSLLDRRVAEGSGMHRRMSLCLAEGARGTSRHGWGAAVTACGATQGDGEVGVPPPRSRALSERRCWIGEGGRDAFIDAGSHETTRRAQRARWGQWKAAAILAPDPVPALHLHGP